MNGGGKTRSELLDGTDLFKSTAKDS